MTTHTSLRVHDWDGDPIPEEVSDSPLRKGEVRLAVEACGVGLTVLNWIRGDVIQDRALLPFTPGHEIVGRVVEVAGDSNGDLLGRRATTHAYLFCGSCEMCIAGCEGACKKLDGWIGLHREGGYATQVVVPGKNIVPLPDSLDPVSATVVPDAVSTSVHVCRSRARLTPEDRVVVIGAGGGVGIHMIQVARAWGAAVVGLDVDAKKLGAIDDLGVVAQDSTDLDSLDISRVWGGASPTAVIDLVGRTETLAWSLAALEIGGRLLALTTFRDMELSIDPRQLVLSEISLVGSRSASIYEYAIAGDLVARGVVVPIIGQVCGPGGIPDLHQSIRHGSVVGRGALDWSAAREPT